MYVSGNAPSNVQPNYVACENPIVYDEKNPGMAFCCYLQVTHKGGTVSADLDGLKIQEAEEVVFYLTAADGYKKYNQRIETNPEVCEKSCGNQIQKLNSKTYKELEEEHMERMIVLCVFFKTGKIISNNWSFIPAPSIVAASKILLLIVVKSAV